MPSGFAEPAAIGDTITALLAMLSFVALGARWRFALVVVWVFNVFGAIDLVHALVQGLGWARRNIQWVPGSSPPSSYR